MSAGASYRLQPRFRGLALGALAIGALAVIAAALGLIAPEFRIASIAAGLIGGLLGIFYLRSPAWRMTVAVSESRLLVTRSETVLLDLPWKEIERVVLGPERSSLFIDGGSAERSLLIPGPGAPAPYDIENKAELIDEILRRLPASVVEPGGDASPADSTDV